MPDRSLRLPPLLLREQRPSPTPPRSSGDAPSGGDGPADGNGSAGGGDSSGGRGSAPDAPASTPSNSDDNPFAPPPEGTPDRPWQPRRPAGGQGADENAGSGPRGESPWGSQWSDRQPGPSSGGGFGDRPGAPQGQGGPEGPAGGPGSGMRWDPTDPAQRRARYALLSGMWAFFFALFSWPYVALLLGALALYWGGSALRAKPRTPDPDVPAPDRNARPQTTAAVSGIVTASLAILMVAATFTAQLVYSDYYACTNDALTSAARESCNDLLPKELQGVLGTRG
ncbi:MULTISPECIES: hypothetical protein [Streptomyces]|uniref:Integral membrane protein n=1 Tax=Streptomyces dengpaensis TaxID=2049881 RepID=A0ABM6SQS8_9ACTN|nr:MULTISPECIES: hypothetical protein [Streptomyces]AVH56961.1 hypothetical protein C4B68_15565 [Streptomyces dengpaensis]PIB09138.1 hypothetical protein B1C81_12950 [Streptomyces sp. HG99]